MKFFLLIVSVFIPLFAYDKNDFAYGHEINIEKNTGVFKLRLSADVLHRLVYTSLSDIRVFDASGHMMPMQVYTPTSNSSTSQLIEVPFAQFDVLKSNKDEEMHFEYKGALIDVLSIGKTKNEDYIVDLRSASTAVEKIYISSDDKKYMISVDIECSNDLEKWVLMKEKATLASLAFQGTFLQKTEIKLPFRKCQYLRLRTDQEFKVSSIQIQEYPVKKEADVEVETISYKKNRNALEFEVSKNIKIQRLNFSINDKEQLYKLNVYAKQNAQDEWKIINKSQIYTINLSGKRLEKHYLRLGAKYKFYRVEAQESSYLPSDVSLSYTRKRQDLYFLAQGDEPYTLAVGSFVAKSQNSTFTNFVKTAAVEARLGKRFDLGGIDRLGEVHKINYKKYFVWFALVFGVLILGYISFVLYKQIQEKS